MAICLSSCLSHKKRKSNHGESETFNFSSHSRALLLFESLSVFFCFFVPTSNLIFYHSPDCLLLWYALMYSTHVFTWEARSTESNLHSASQPVRSSKSVSEKASETCQQSVAYFCVCEGVCMSLSFSLSLSPFTGWNHCGGTSNKVLSRFYLRVMIS